MMDGSMALHCLLYGTVTLLKVYHLVKLNVENMHSLQVPAKYNMMYKDPILYLPITSTLSP